MAELLARRTHGGIDEAELAELGVDARTLVDFSVNLNPYGPPPALLEVVHSAALAHYPDMHARAARVAWASAFGCDAGCIAVGHGAADLFWAIARALVAPSERVVIAEPTFSEFRIAAAALGAELVRPFAAPERGHALDLDQLGRVAHGARALYLCSPNNPTGESFDAAQLASFARALAPTFLVLDRSFLALSDHAHEERVALPDNVVVVRSLTKEFACPGLRIGLCRATPRVIARVEAQRPTWATSSPALAALAWCAAAQPFVRESYARMRADREAVRALLVARGFAPLPSATTFQLVPLTQPAATFRKALARAGVLVRDCASFGLPRHVRIAALPEAHRGRLGEALDMVASAR
jgi:histidinol-phosphate/aromatic aminotransferase/cobyric acid decarboxylase-like protein